MARRVALLLVFLVLLSSCEVLSGQSSPPQQVSFTVEAGAKHTIAINLREGGGVSGTFSVSGKENFVDFYIKDPNGGLAYGVVRAQGGLTFDAQAATVGVYTMYFDNAFSFGSSRDITLTYQTR